MTTDQDWKTRPERGVVPVMKAFVWVALHLGRSVARLFLYPVCLYFLMFSAKARQASRDYLHRALGKNPDLSDVYRHYFTFAACVLDRIFLLNDQINLFDVRIHGEEVVTELVQQGNGCILFGAHIGSFEVLRTIGRRQPGLSVSMVMYEDNARKINAVLNAINPALEMDVIALGRSNSLLLVEEKLSQGNFVGVLADRSLEANEGEVRHPFLGGQAAFPTGPFRMAAMLRRPVVLMVGLYRGRNLYDVHFERLPDGEAALPRYVERLEDICHQAPYNWFNFYDFWK